MNSEDYVKGIIGNFCNINRKEIIVQRNNL